MDIISIIITDDHEIFRKGLITVLNEIPFVKVVGEAANGSELLKLLKNTIAEVIIMDIKMSVMDGVDATKKVKEQYPDVSIIALTMHEEVGYFNKMIDAGATGFLLKKTNKEQLENAIKTVYNGESFYAEEFEMFAKRTKIVNKSKIVISDREKEVLELICKGFSNSEIADKLGLSQRTIDGHKARLFEKTGAKNSANLVLFAVKNGLINA